MHVVKWESCTAVARRRQFYVAVKGMHRMLSGIPTRPLGVLHNDIAECSHVGWHLAWLKRPFRTGAATQRPLAERVILLYQCTECKQESVQANRRGTHGGYTVAAVYKLAAVY